MYHTVVSLKFPLGDYTILTLQPEANDVYLHLKLRRLMTKKKNHILHLYMIPQQVTNRD